MSAWDRTGADRTPESRATVTGTARRCRASSSRWPRCRVRSCSAVLAAVAVATVAGVVLLWPDSGKVDDLQGSVGFAVEGATFPDGGRRRGAARPAREPGPDEQPDTSEPCGQVTVTVAEGADEGTEVDRRRAARGQRLPGSRRATASSCSARRARTASPPSFGYFEIERSTSLWLVARAVRGGRARRRPAARPDGPGRARVRRCGGRRLRDPGPAHRRARGARRARAPRR